MPYTEHGYWYGGDEPTPQPARTMCGGPHWCERCALEAHRGDQTIPPQHRPSWFRRVFGRWGRRKRG